MSIRSPSIESDVNLQTKEDKEVQTVIKVYPFILQPSTLRASVTSDKKFCTVLSLEASQDSAKFYSLLQYCPYHDIEENSLRVINLPRKTKLQWVAHKYFPEEALKKISLADDDGVADIGEELFMRLQHGKKTTFMDSYTQTDLTVRPYLLEEPKVAVVFRTVDIQVTLPMASCKSTRLSSF